MSRALSFEGPDVDEPLDFRTLNPKDPAHPVLRTFGRLFIMAVSQRCRADPEEEVFSSLAAYERLAPGYPLAELEPPGQDGEQGLGQHLLAITILMSMNDLRQLIAPGGEEGLKYKRLGTGLAEVFGTYYAGIRDCDGGVVSRAGIELVLKLAIAPPSVSWVNVFTRGADGRIARARRMVRHRNAQSPGGVATSNNSTSGAASSHPTELSQNLPGGGTTDATEGAASASMAPSGGENHDPGTPSAREVSVVTDPPLSQNPTAAESLRRRC
ncbi:hypothetical protein QFC20_003583 [Naganishia adeliensis]|uniref:Uncharacterized protein n=1 Tax=Naganishia adeliensis TaxID=92952 RepID=A0ACC2W9Z2_9TREE|nr:hypothetical protein QFC20_003583 [Naganishia adeliensis]